MDSPTSPSAPPTDVIRHRPSRLFIFLAGFFVANALVAELIGVKIFALEDTLGIAPWNFNLFGEMGALQFSAGVLLWPLVFLMTDLLNEYYGRRGVQTLSVLTAGLILYAFVMIYAAIGLVPADWWVGQSATRGVPDSQAAFAVTFGQGLYIIVGSLAAFLLAQITDVVVFQRIKRRTGEKKLWLRATGSTLISQLVDSFSVASQQCRAGVGHKLLPFAPFGHSTTQPVRPHTGPDFEPAGSRRELHLQRMVGAGAQRLGRVRQDRYPRRGSHRHAVER